MAILRKFPNGFEIHGGRMTKDEESEFYARIGQGPKVILRGQRGQKQDTGTPDLKKKTNKSEK